MAESIPGITVWTVDRRLTPGSSCYILTCLAYKYMYMYVQKKFIFCRQPLLRSLWFWKAPVLSAGPTEIALFSRVYSSAHS